MMGRAYQDFPLPFSSSRVDVTLPEKETTMLAMWVKVRIKPEMREKFLKAIEVDALGSERDEPGCMRFNVLRDEKDENVYYYYADYADQAARKAHRTAPH